MQSSDGYSGNCEWGWDLTQDSWFKLVTPSATEVRSVWNNIFSDMAAVMMLEIAIDIVRKDEGWIIQVPRWHDSPAVRDEGG